MTKSEALRHVTELQAERELLTIGWTKAPCETCNGAGRFERAINEIPMFEGMAKAAARRICERCEGYGWRWKAPSTCSISS